jgi:DinB family
MNHLVHHRAQLGTYLRLLDVPVPAVYGPSADDEDVILINPELSFEKVLMAAIRKNASQSRDNQRFKL